MILNVFVFWLYRLIVRTSAFQALNLGAIPSRVTKVCYNLFMESKPSLPPETEKDPSRRDFLKKAGYLGAAALTADIIAKFSPISPKNEQAKDDKKHEQFIIDQVNEIKKIIEGKKYNEILSNSYLASYFYYSQSFLDEISNSKNEDYVSEKIIRTITHLITPEFRKQVILELEKQTKEKELFENKTISTKEVAPLKDFSFAEGESHKDAIDLFTNESSPIYSMKSGLVIIADKGWRLNDELSSSSMSGGNAVIVFNYLTKEFFRYAHLDKVAVNPGELIMESENLGTVGHTGKNASLLGHGQHLHLEINKYLSKKNINQSLSTNDLKKRLENLKTQ
jgi:hypothetical protein